MVSRNIYTFIECISRGSQSGILSIDLTLVAEIGKIVEESLGGSDD